MNVPESSDCASHSYSQRTVNNIEAEEKSFKLNNLTVTKYLAKDKGNTLRK